MYIRVKFPPKNLNLDSYPSTLTSTYTCKVIDHCTACVLVLTSISSSKKKKFYFNISKIIFPILTCHFTQYILHHIFFFFFFLPLYFNIFFFILFYYYSIILPFFFLLHHFIIHPT